MIGMCDFSKMGIFNTNIYKWYVVTYKYAHIPIIYCSLLQEGGGSIKLILQMLTCV